MADVNLPSISELAQMQFLPAGQYATARNNINLANQFQQQNLQQGEYGLQQSLMNNQFQAANDPVKLLANQQALDTATSEGILKKIDAQQRQALAPQEQEAKRAKFISTASDEKLADLMSRTQADMVDPNAPPEKQQAAKEAFERSSKEWSSRLKAKDELAKQQAELTSKEGIAGGNNATSIRVAEIGAGSRENVARLKQKQQASYEQALAGSKSYAQAANIATAFASSATDPEVQDYYQKEAERFSAKDVASRAAGVATGAQTKIDPAATAATGVVTMQPNPTAAVPPPTPKPANFSVSAGPRADLAPPTQPVGAGATNPTERQMAQGVSDQILTQGDPRVPRELANARALLANGGLDAKTKAAVTEYVSMLESKMAPQNSQKPSAPPATAKATELPARPAPPGRVYIFKDGKAVGSVPQGQSAEAVKQGYTLQ